MLPNHTHGGDRLKTEVLGVLFDNLTRQEAAQRGAQLLAEDKFHYVVTPNPEFILAAEKDEEFRAVLNGADLVLPDGIGVVYSAKIQGTPLKERVPGIEFAADMLTCLNERHGRLFLLGAKPGVADKAAQALKESFPQLAICGTHHGYFKDAAPVVEAIREARADVVFVCLGAPKQEQWMAQYGPDTGAHLMVGLGGVLDVYAGNVKRAPEVWQKLGLEWCYRLVHQPSRLGRMAKLPLFLVDAKRESRRKDRP